METGIIADAPANPTQVVHDESKESKKRQEKDRKKGEKKSENFMKSIANLTAEEKVDALCKKNTELIDQSRNLKTSIQLLQRKIIVLDREKEQLQNDQSKGVLARSRLEALCRELQRQNKSIKDESLQKIREEEEKRKEVSVRFQTALNEVSQMMQQNTDKNLKLRDDNIEISNKFQKLCEQFKQREEEVIRLTKQMDLEKQLAEATLKRTECQLNAERGIWTKEKEHYIAQLKVYEEEKQKLETNIKSLEEHLSMYSTHYDEFENTITKSNKVFDSYKVEMNRMSKQISKFEQESSTWKERWLQSQQAVNRITNEHRICDQNIQDREKKLKHLTDLCRSIQDERSAYLKQLKENGLTPVVVVHVEKTAVKSENKTNNSSHKITKKEKELSVLKNEMQMFEKQLADSLKSSQKQKDAVDDDNSSSIKKSDENNTSTNVSVVSNCDTKLDNNVDTQCTDPTTIVTKNVEDLSSNENVICDNIDDKESSIPSTNLVNNKDTQVPLEDKSESTNIINTSNSKTKVKNQRSKKNKK